MGALLYGQVADYWYPPGVPFAPLALNPGKITGMAVNTGSPPYPAEEYRTNLTPRVVTLGASPAVVYNEWLRWNHGSPRAYWGPSFVVKPGVGYYPVFQPNGDPVASPAPRPRPKDNPWEAPIEMPWSSPATTPLPNPFPGLFPESDPAPEPSPVPTPIPGIVLAIDVYPNGGWKWVSGKGKPPKGTKERKSRHAGVAAALSIAFGIASSATEVIDFIDCLLVGFGLDSGSVWANINAIIDAIENGAPFDMQAFIEALIREGLIDKVSGRMNAALRRRLRNLGIRVTGSVSPNVGAFA